MRKNLLTAPAALAIFVWSAGALPASQQAPQQVRTEIKYSEGVVVLTSDVQERTPPGRYSARGNVEITYRDIRITCDEAEFEERTREGSARGNLRFSQDRQWFTCSRAEFNLASQTGTFYDASGFTDQEFLIRGSTVVKKGPDTYSVQDGFITACQERNPKWSFTIASATVRVDRTARLRNTLFKVKGVPVLYVPYLVLPLANKQRSSGLLPPHIGSSTSKGRAFSLGYFQTLGRSADITFYGDYFTLRGMALGGVLRTRPTPQTRLYLQAYGIHDRLDQGGAQLILDGESSLPRGFRAVASANITTNFRFRQAFSDSFRSATVPEERSMVFMTQNQNSFSTNIAFLRDEVLFPGRSIVIRQAPSLEFRSLGRKLGRTPLIFHLRAGADAVSRTDSGLETPRLVQRLDLYPRLTLRLPSLAGISLVPSVGIRETYYSAGVTDGNDPKIDPSSIHRQYMDLELDLRLPTIERTYRGSRLGSFKHTIEPFTMYRRIHGIDNARRIVRFDEQDAIADTNELEFGVVNRIFTRRGGPGASGQEWLLVAVVQKYYFDPSFGQALVPGQSNIFYPLNTVTGFASLSEPRSLPPTNLIVRLTPMPSVSYDFRADYDTRYERLRDASLSVHWQEERFIASGTYVKTNALATGTFESHHIQGLLGYGSPMRGLSASAVISYNIRTANLLNSNMRLNYIWDCCGVSLQFQQFDLGLRTESRLTFSFSLKGIGSFGNIRRAESLF
ncbi:MAG: LPS assembly protein LptD [Acidobacteriota bacterium]